jgi:hypothetical protein
MSFQTISPYNITQNSFVSGGKNVPSGITKKGICWNTAFIPKGLLTTSKLEITGNDATDYSLSVFGLVPNTKYYVKAYYYDSSSVLYEGLTYSFFTVSSDLDSTIDTFEYQPVTINQNETYIIPPGYELIGINYGSVSPSAVTGCTTLADLNTATVSSRN